MNIGVHVSFQFTVFGQTVIFNYSHAFSYFHCFRLYHYKNTMKDILINISLCLVSQEQIYRSGTVKSKLYISLKF